jgi:hypothetical protein
MAKKGEIEIQFNWIFIMIAGALIFLFFFSIIRWAMKSSDDSASVTTANYLDSILTSAAVTKDTVTAVDAPFNQLDFKCANGFKIDNGQWKQINNKIIFAPNRLVNGKLVTWSMSWDAPFRITNFLFVTSPQERYIFIGGWGDEVFKYLNQSVPKEIKAEFNPITTDDKNNFKVRFVYVNTEPDRDHAIKFSKMGAADVTALKITDTSISGEASFDLSFYKKSLPGATIASWQKIGDTATANDDASLWGAIFTDDPTDYTCNMGKANERYNLVASIYEKRSELLFNYYSSNGNFECANIHSQAKTSLESSLSNLNTPPNLNGLNENAQQKSCALIY